MSATCPACGVPVVPGYVRCPKCQAPLPARRAATVAGPGGTAVSGGGGLPTLPLVVGGAIVLVIVLVVALRGGSSKPTTANEVPADATEDTTPDPAGDPTPTPTPTGTAPTPEGADPAAAAGELRNQLQRQRLWGTVQVVGTRVEVRTGACGDPNMGAVLDASSASLKDAGLTAIRCMEQSGAVVFERDL